MSSFKTMCHRSHSFLALIRHPAELTNSSMTDWQTAYAKLWAVVNIVMLLSHGQATAVEQGFSISKEVECYNLQEDTFTARRLICDHVNAVGGILNIDVANKESLQVQLQELDRNIWPIWTTKRRHNRLDGRGKLLVMKWKN